MREKSLFIERENNKFRLNWLTSPLHNKYMKASEKLRCECEWERKRRLDYDYDYENEHGNDTNILALFIKRKMNKQRERKKIHFGMYTNRNANRENLNKIRARLCILGICSCSCRNCCDTGPHDTQTFSEKYAFIFVKHNAAPKVMPIKYINIVRYSRRCCRPYCFYSFWILHSHSRCRPIQTLCDKQRIWLEYKFMLRIELCWFVYFVVEPKLFSIYYWY